jgi:hypothetical protein
MSNKLRGKRWTDEEIDLGLRVLAKHFGNAAAAGRELKTLGTPIPTRTLADWRDIRHTERYRETRAEVEKLVLQDMAEEMLRASKEDGDAADAARKEFLKQLKAGEVAPRDLSGAVRNFRVSQALGVDKSRLVVDRPTDIVEHKYDLAAIERAIRATQQVIDAEAAELPPAPEIEP